MESTDLLIVGAGQSGLAAAHAAREQGLDLLVLDASESTAGSWPRYYDSLALFSPARYSALPAVAMAGDPDRYPSRDEVVSYLEAYGRRFADDLRLGERVESVERFQGEGLIVKTEAGSEYHAGAVIAATGHFGSPFRPNLTGLDSFDGTVVHSADYISAGPFTGSRTVVVGAGNSAVQIAAELAEQGDVTLATKGGIRWVSQRPIGRDVHWWLARTGLDTVRTPRLLSRLPASVIDDGRYRSAIAEGAFDRRPMFDRIEGSDFVWRDGSRERVDHLILATGYRPDIPYLSGLGALSRKGMPLHSGGLSTVVPGLGFVGVEFQRSFSSNTLRGCGRDAAHVVKRLRPVALAASRHGLAVA